MTPPLLEIRRLQMHFPLPGGRVVKAVDNVDLDIARGEVVGVVGESGSGKTTLGRTILRLLQPTGGSLRFDGTDITHLGRAAMRPFRRRMQIVFQDPYASLNPRRRVRDIIGEALVIHAIGTRQDRRDRIAALLEQVGLPIDAMDRYPHEFSGGQRQRVGIARAIAVEPDFIVADEPVSALDVSVQVQVVNLLQDLQRQFGLTILFVAHDMAVVQYVSDRVAVVYLGHIVEVAPSNVLYAAPRHPYTRALMDAAPVPDPRMRRERIPLQGEVPSPAAPPSGCVFRTRCPHAMDACAAIVPTLSEVGPGHLKACLRDDLPAWQPMVTPG